MNKHNAKLFLPIVEALAAGKQIQVKAHFSGDWMNAEPDLRFDSPPESYRVQPPEPRRIFVNRYPDSFGFAYESKADADAVASPNRVEGRAIEFVEVIS